MQKNAIIVAGGKGVRMNTDIPKQFIEINGLPILMHTLKAFRQYDSEMGLILVLPEAQIDFWNDLCKKYDFSVPHQVVAGGETRFHSVKNGLAVADDDALIAVHDGVRPLVSQDTIARCFREAEIHQAVIPVMGVIESIRYVDVNENKACNRDSFVLVQTPQVFNGKLLKKAYGQEYSPAFTDDASVVEALGEKIRLVEGNRENIKITTAFDLTLAACMLEQGI